MKTLILVTIITCYVFSSVYGYIDCGSDDGSIVSVQVSDCDNESRCILKRGTNVSIAIGFESNVESDEVKAVVHGVVLGIPMPFDLQNPDGCKDSGIQCPIVKGQSYKYTASLPVLQEYPKVTVDVKWELQDKDGQDIICVMIPAKLQ